MKKKILAKWWKKASETKKIEWNETIYVKIVNIMYRNHAHDGEKKIKWWQKFRPWKGNGKGKEEKDQKKRGKRIKDEKLWKA